MGSEDSRRLNRAGNRVRLDTYGTLTVRRGEKNQPIVVHDYEASKTDPSTYNVLATMFQQRGEDSCGAFKQCMCNLQSRIRDNIRTWRQRHEMGAEEAVKQYVGGCEVTFSEQFPAPDPSSKPKDKSPSKPKARLRAEARTDRTTTSDTEHTLQRRVHKLESENEVLSQLYETSRSQEQVTRAALVTAQHAAKTAEDAAKRADEQAAQLRNRPPDEHDTRNAEVMVPWEETTFVDMLHAQMNSLASKGVRVQKVVNVLVAEARRQASRVSRGASSTGPLIEAFGVTSGEFESLAAVQPSLDNILGDDNRKRLRGDEYEDCPDDVNMTVAGGAIAPLPDGHELAVVRKRRRKGT